MDPPFVMMYKIKTKTTTTEKQRSNINGLFGLYIKDNCIGLFLTIFLYLMMLGCNPHAMGGREGEKGSWTLFKVLVFPHN